jgi:hypothetical protein
MYLSTLVVSCGQLCPADRPEACLRAEEVTPLAFRVSPSVSQAIRHGAKSHSLISAEFSFIDSSVYLILLLLLAFETYTSCLRWQACVRRSSTSVAKTTLPSGTIGSIPNGPSRTISMSLSLHTPRPSFVQRRRRRSRAWSDLQPTMDIKCKPSVEGIPTPTSVSSVSIRTGLRRV